MVRKASAAAKATVVADGVSPPSLELAALPPAVARLRTRILQATATAQIDDLLIPIQWNEVPPLFMRNQPQRFDALAFLRQRSFDGQGREMLRVMANVFRQPYAVATRGMTVTYVWPQFPVVPERQPLAGERLAPWRCVRFADLGARGPDGGPLVHKTAIGIDGTWHYFWTEP